MLVLILVHIHTYTYALTPMYMKTPWRERSNVTLQGVKIMVLLQLL